MAVGGRTHEPQRAGARGRIPALLGYRDNSKSLGSWGTLPFTLTRTGEAKFEPPPPKSTPITKDFEGSWSGALDVQGTVLRLTLKLANNADGVATGTLVSVDQGGVEIPIPSVIQTGTHLTLNVRMISATYEGDLKDGQLTGTWTQAPSTLPLTFKRSN